MAGEKPGDLGPEFVVARNEVVVPASEDKNHPERRITVEVAMEVPKRKQERVEMNGEHIPTKGEVLELIGQLIIGDATLIGVDSDDQGLYSMDVEIPGDTPTERTVYSYRRGVGGPQSFGKKCSIEIEYWDGEDPVGGKTAADCFEGVWTIKTKPVVVKHRE